MSHPPYPLPRYHALRRGPWYYRGTIVVLSWYYRGTIVVPAWYYRDISRDQPRTTGPAVYGREYKPGSSRVGRSRPSKPCLSKPPGFAVVGDYRRLTHLGGVFMAQYRDQGSLTGRCCMYTSSPTSITSTFTLVVPWETKPSFRAAPNHRLLPINKGHTLDYYTGKYLPQDGGIAYHCIREPP